MYFKRVDFLVGDYGAGEDGKTRSFSTSPAVLKLSILPCLDTEWWDYRHATNSGEKLEKEWPKYNLQQQVKVFQMAC